MHCWSYVDIYGGIIVGCWEQPSKESKQDYVQVAFSFCSPEDAHKFQKHIARNKSRGRLVQGKQVTNLFTDKDNGPHNIGWLIKEFVLNGGEEWFPDWYTMHSRFAPGSLPVAENKTKRLNANNQE